jgi:hypothetical protein
MSWYKGNIHCHTTESDGDLSPEEVAEWYGENGYDFLVISDHNRLTSLGESTDPPQGRRPLMIAGEELTVNLEGQEAAVYVNSVGISRAVEPINASEVLQTIQANVNAVLEAGGVAALCAPYYRPGFDPRSLKEIEGARLVDVYNAHPLLVKGDPRTFSFEEIWDEILSSGKTIFGTATDDAHHYLEFGPDKANPGRAWIVVRARELSSEAIIHGIESGDFYASTGVSLSEVEASKDSLSVRIEPTDGNAYRVAFIGRGGSVLAEEVGPEATYRLRGDEGYVRARVTSSDGARAWMQPVMAG